VDADRAVVEGLAAAVDAVKVVLVSGVNRAGRFQHLIGRVLKARKTGARGSVAPLCGQFLKRFEILYGRL
jgi:hypothetical protein